MEEAESQTTADTSDYEELSDWSEDDLSLHFSASVLESSESETETGPSLNPGQGLDPGPCLDPGPAEVKRRGQSQVKDQGMSPELYLESKPRPQQERPRPHLILRQHSLPESGGGAYKGLIAGLQPAACGAGTLVQRKLQKSVSLDESQTKNQASCLIKNVLSKRMQEEDHHQGAPKSSLPQSSPRARPAALPLSSKPPSRPQIKLAASLSQSQRRAETNQPITAQNHPEHNDKSQSEPTSAESRAPPSGDAILDPLRFCSRDSPQRSVSAQERASAVGHSRPVFHRFSSSRRLQPKASCSSSHIQEQSSSQSPGPAEVNPASPSDLHPEPRHASTLEQGSPLGQRLPPGAPPWVPPRDTLPSSSSCQDQRAPRGQRQLVVASPWFSSRDAPHSSHSAQDPTSSLGCVHPITPWSSSRELQAPRPSGSAPEKGFSVGRVRPALPHLSSRETPRSTQDQASSLGLVRRLPMLTSGELQAPRPSDSAQEEASSVGQVQHLPWLTSGDTPSPSHSAQDHASCLGRWQKGKGPLQRKALLDPETGQFVQVFIPVPGPAPLLHSPAPMFPSPAPSLLSLGYGTGLLTVAPSPAVLVPVQSTVFTQPCIILPPLQPWVYYRPT